MIVFRSEKCAYSLCGVEFTPRDFGKKHDGRWYHDKRCWEKDRELRRLKLSPLVFLKPDLVRQYGSWVRVMEVFRTFLYLEGRKAEGGAEAGFSGPIEAWESFLINRNRTFKVWGGMTGKVAALFNSGLTGEEIKAAVGLSRGAVSNHKKKALKAGFLLAQKIRDQERLRLIEKRRQGRPRACRR